MCHALWNLYETCCVGCVEQLFIILRQANHSSRCYCCYFVVDASCSCAIRLHAMYAWQFDGPIHHGLLFV